jgi:hypothetical protein
LKFGVIRRTKGEAVEWIEIGGQRNTIADVKPLISDLSTESRVAGLEKFVERYLGPRRPEYGTPEEELRLVEMPAPLERFFRFAGRWPGQNPASPFANRFCAQDELCRLQAKEYARVLRLEEDRLVFVVENQSVWWALTERTGDDPPVWIKDDVKERKLEEPLSHFLVSFVLQDLTFGSEAGVASELRALEKLMEAGMPVEPIWLNGEYAENRRSYYLIGDRFLLLRAQEQGDGEDFYGCNQIEGMKELKSLGLPTGFDEEPIQRKKWWSFF